MNESQRRISETTIAELTHEKVMIIFSSKELFLTITALKCHTILMQAIFAKMTDENSTVYIGDALKPVEHHTFSKKYKSLNTMCRLFCSVEKFIAKSTESPSNQCLAGSYKIQFNSLK